MLNLVANGPSGYNLARSLRFRSSASAYLSRTPSTSSNRRTWTWSAWVKRGSLGSYQVLFGAGLNNGVNADELVSIYFTNSDQLGHYVNETGVADRNNISTAVFRDPSAWYHIVAIYDSTQATASQRQRLFVNNVEITSWSATSYVSQNYQPSVNSSAYPHAIGKYGFNATRYLDGYLTEVNFIDGQALTPSSFGSTNSTTGVWQPAKYTGTYGTNGFYLPFTDTSSTTNLVKDSSGNANNWTPNNISLTAGTTYDSMTDVPTLTSATAANYCTFNPLAYTNVFTYSNANLTATGTSGGSNVQAQGTMAVSSGKWYWEITDLNGGAGSVIGISDITVSTTTSVGTSSLSYGYVANSGNKINNGSSVAYGATFGANDVIGIALDLDSGTLTFYKNNTSQGTAYSSLSGTFLPAVSDSSGASTPAYTANFGQQGFKYTPPTGFVALNTYNLPTSTIVKGNTVMDATTYTGTGSNRSVTNTAGFKPDLVWLKVRNQAYGHALFDSIRGVGNGLQSNNTNAEDAWGTSTLASFNTNGFGLGADTIYLIANSSGNTYVGWQWQAGQGTNTSNTNGSITSTVSVNASAGFSVVTYTNQSSGTGTVGHGLGVAPAMIITKQRGSAGNWRVYHKSLAAGYYLLLNTTAAQSNTLNIFTTTLPTSTVFSTGTTVAGEGTAVAYCWAEIAGFSKAFSYTGNGSSDGVFVYLGFRPKYVMIKNSGGGATSSLQGWIMIDTSRSPYNLTADALFANNSNASNSGTGYGIDMLSNGFKTRGTDGSINESSATYIGIAFAENPFKNALAR